MRRILADFKGAQSALYLTQIFVYVGDDGLV